MRLAQAAATYHLLVRMRKRAFSACMPPCGRPGSVPSGIYCALSLLMPERHLVLKES